MSDNSFNEGAVNEGADIPEVHDDQGSSSLGSSEGSALDRASAAAGRARDAATGRFVPAADHMDHPGNDDRNVRDALAELFARREEAAKERPPTLTSDLVEGGVSKVPDFGQDLSPRRMAAALAEYRQQEAAWIAEVEAASAAQADAALFDQPANDRGVSQAPTAQEELTAVQQELEQQRQVRDFWNRAPQQAMGLAQQRAELDAIYRRDFADIKTPQDLDRLMQTDPQRTEQLRSLMTAMQTNHQQLNQVAQAVTAVNQQEFARYAAAEDSKFLRQYPQYGDPRRAPELQQAALTMLRDLGYSPEQVAHLWNNDRVFRSAQAQAIMADAAQFRAARANFKAGATIKQDLPNVQRPGARATEGGLPPPGGRPGDIARYEKEMSRATGGSMAQLKAAAALHRARVGR